MADTYGRTKPGMYRVYRAGQRTVLLEGYAIRLHSAPATFQRALDRVFGLEMEPHAFAYLDDIIVIGKTKDEHRENLREVFRTGVP